MAQPIEAVNFNPGTYYDAIHYMTIAGKLRNITGGLKWFTLTKERPFRTFKIKLRSKVKRMNPYTFFGVLTGVPPVDTFDQIPLAADTTNVTHVHVDWTVRYNEWNENFDFEKI